MKKLSILVLVSLLLFTACPLSPFPGSLKKAKPDLVITHIGLSGNVYCSIANKGLADAGPSTCKLIINGETVAYRIVDSIPKGAEYGQDAFSWAGTCVNGYGLEDTIQVVADVYYQVDEANEENNTYTTNGHCKPY